MWRLHFAKFVVVEIELSDLFMYHANLVLQQCSFASYCTLENNDKCLVVSGKELHYIVFRHRNSLGIDQCKIMFVD
ncbi:hypothetical protein Hanom_Chr10g00931761 [Helianthus anomalus]